MHLPQNGIPLLLPTAKQLANLHEEMCCFHRERWAKRMVGIDLSKFVLRTCANRLSKSPDVHFVSTSKTMVGFNISPYLDTVRTDCHPPNWLLASILTWLRSSILLMDMCRMVQGTTAFWSCLYPRIFFHRVARMRLTERKRKRGVGQGPLKETIPPSNYP